MTKFTKERIEQILSFADGSNPSEAITLRCDEVAAMARQMLAGLEQEPVAFIARYESGAIHGTCDRDDPVKMEWLKRGMAVSPLYAAAQLPQPAVADEAAIFEAAIDVCRKSDAIDEHAWNHGVLSVMAAFDKCRAAMLQGVDQSQNAQQNIPENIPTLREGLAAIRNSGIAIDAEKIQAERDALNEPDVPDGYSLVPVDMTPDMMRAVQLNSELGAYASANLSGAYSLFREFWDVAVKSAPNQEAE